MTQLSIACRDIVEILDFYLLASMPRSAAMLQGLSKIAFKR